MPPKPDLYDTVSYPAFAYGNTHPSRLAAMATLHGLQPAPVDRCRVLEIGCNNGANIIPMAYALPGSTFVGFDLAALPVKSGQEKIAALGLSNVRILQADLMDAARVPELGGDFDYIIAHGIYAWVPSPVRDGLLRFCRERLARNGIVFISYAALPGGYLRMLTRDIVRFRDEVPAGLSSDPAANAEDAVTAVRNSMDHLQFLAGCRPEGDGFRVLVEREVAGMRKRGPEAVFHDELGTFYQPVSFSQFARHAAEHGLRYFSESELPSPTDPGYKAETAKAIQQLSGGDWLAGEQMLDFARMRVYRESLLCHDGAPFTPDIQASALHRLSLSSPAVAADGSTPGSRLYELPKGVRIETQSPATVALLDCLLACFPKPVPFPDIAADLGSRGLLTEADLLTTVLRLVVADMIDLDAWQPPVLRQVPERPVASALCRFEAGSGTAVTTLLHTRLGVEDPFARHLLLLLDGTRDRDALLQALTEAFPEAPAAQLAEGLGPALELLRRAGVLQAPADGNAIGPEGRR